MISCRHTTTMSVLLLVLLLAIRIGNPSRHGKLIALLLCSSDGDPTSSTRSPDEETLQSPTSGARLLLSALYTCDRNRDERFRGVTWFLPNDPSKPYVWRQSKEEEEQHVSLESVHPPSLSSTSSHCHYCYTYIPHGPPCAWSSSQKQDQAFAHYLRGAAHRKRPMDGWMDGKVSQSVMARREQHFKRALRQGD